jgi:hypothetical protein
LVVQAAAAEPTAAAMAVRGLTTPTDGPAVVVVVQGTKVVAGVKKQPTRGYPVPAAVAARRTLTAAVVVRQIRLLES